MNIYRQLAEPLPSHRISWRISHNNRANTSALVLAYLDARDVMNKLDFVCGPSNWQVEYHDAGNGKTCCSISIKDPDSGEWVTKSDGAGDTDISGDKGAFSDAFKRAAVLWGIGRYLYDVKNVWADIEQAGTNRQGKPTWKIKSAAYPALQERLARINKDAQPDLNKLHHIKVEETTTKLKEME